jgi:signal transduction histidine kinase
MEESEYILQLLNALMDLSEVQSGEMNLLPAHIALRELVDEVIELYAIVAEERGIAIHNNIPTYLTVEADRLRVRQCLANLIDNALKYSAAGTTVILSGESSDAGIELRISDQGCGITENEIDKIWDRLYRAEPSRATPGLGLGLSLVKAIVEAHGGKVSVESRPGEGSVFIFRLPRAPHNERAA